MAGEEPAPIATPMFRSWASANGVDQAAARVARQCASAGPKCEKATGPAPAAGARRIYLHARPEYAAVCDEVKRILSQDGIAPLSAVADPGRDIADWTRESRARIETAKRCDALALVRGDGDERFIGDLIEIGVDERERMQIGARRAAALRRARPLGANAADRRFRLRDRAVRSRPRTIGAANFTAGSTRRASSRPRPP